MLLDCFTLSKLDEKSKIETRLKQAKMKKSKKRLTLRGKKQTRIPSSAPFSMVGKKTRENLMTFEKPEKVSVMTKRIKMHKARRSAY